jgi:hypothetical protein
MKRDFGYWMQFGAVTAVTAALTATFINIAAAFAADVANGQTYRSEAKAAQTRFYIHTPSINESIMNELIRGEPEDAQAGPDARRRTDQENSAARGQLPMSMLWPAHKYLPRLSYSLAA